MSLNVLVGTYDNRENEGIYLLKGDSDLDDFEIALKGGIEGKSNNYLAYNPEKSIIYSSHQMEDEGGVAAYTIDRNRESIELESYCSTGANRRPSHIRLDPENQYLISANYEGSISVNPIDDNGHLEEKSDYIQLLDEDLGPHKRQDGSHPHSINTFSGEDDLFIYIPDLGTDKILSYKLTEEGKLAELEDSSIKVENGNGPRHMDVREDLEKAYVVNELDPSINVLDVDPKTGKLDSIEKTGINTNQFEQESLGADITSHSDDVYASIRGRNTIALFDIQDDGRLEFKEEQYLEGESPRNLDIDPEGEKLVSGNRDSNNITIFERNEEHGDLDPKKHVKILEPAYVEIL